MDLSAGLDTARATLLEQRDASGHWVGELSSSALSTATAVAALRTRLRHRAADDGPSLPPGARLRDALLRGARWLAAHPNPDGGWGDTPRSLSNLSTTTLVWAALNPDLPEPVAVPAGGLTLAAEVPGLVPVLEQAERWLGAHAGVTAPGPLATAIKDRYGEDRTFSVPILTLCAVMGRLGTGAAAWREVIPLPFELAACPPSWFAALRLPVVSYALPALIAMGYARHYHAPSANPLRRVLRQTVASRTLARLTGLQPPNGGFLEATPLTSFVVLSLAASGQTAHPVVERGIDFLLASQRPDGSWPIDTNLATWLTTLAVNALSVPTPSPLSASAREMIFEWLCRQQFQAVHPYTQAAPGGWAWTDLPGGVPDADDTAGALLALRQLGADDPRALSAAQAAVRWLLDSQNRDGGIPTFCRGWGRLPFDRSSADITAHALRAWLAWRDRLPRDVRPRLEAASGRAVEFLLRAQHPDGFWLPLWFGNQHRPDEANPVYGTSRVVLALVECAGAGVPSVRPALARGLRWLRGAQLPDGGWGAAPPHPASTEETALAVEALAAELAESVAGSADPDRATLAAAAQRGAEWLLAALANGTGRQPAPIGLYFSRLWYYERLYPLIFTTAALGRLQQAHALATSRVATDNPCA